MEQSSLFGTDQTGPGQTAVSFWPDFKCWQAAARQQWIEGRAPESIWWQPDSQAVSVADHGPPAEGRGPRVTKAFLQIARAAACHRADDRWALLYRLLWRLTHGEAHLLQLAGDRDVARITAYAKSVRRDVHKMKAFVRFRAVAEPGFDSPRYVAWFEPEHFIVAHAAPFFVRRFANMRWSILTPERCVHWEGSGDAWFAPGADRTAAPDGDVIEDAWRTYYASIFNPARVKIRAMQSEMPQKYWKNMPEAHLIPGLIRDADRRVAEMEAGQKTDDALQCGPRPATPEVLHNERAAALPADSLAALAARAATCRRCPLYGPATQTVFGEGPADARLLVVGEQPGDHEDLAGRPFVGPAGQLLDRALQDAGIVREAIYLTNAVKHFKFEPRGKRRLHAKPDYREVGACRDWLAGEIERVDPQVLLCLGATAAQSILQRPVAVLAERSRPIMHAGRRVHVTVHPSYLLRLPDRAAAAHAYRAFVADLACAAAAVLTDTQ